MRLRRRPVRVKLNPVAVWELLDQLGISQKELARRSGISAGSAVPRSVLRVCCSRPWA